MALSAPPKKVSSGKRLLGRSQFSKLANSANRFAWIVSKTASMIPPMKRIAILVILLLDMRQIEYDNLGIDV
jgi:hypothetical protein